MVLLSSIVLGVLVVVAVTAVAPKVGVPSPLILVVVGVAIGLLPVVPDLHVDPDLVLDLVLPALLYSAAVTMPTMDFRRDLRIISGMSVVLVLLSAVAVGLVVTWLIPDVPLAIGIAVGAVISPTDAVATSIVRRTGLAPRMVTVLEGEAMFNDASALALLRSAIAATAASVAWWQLAGSFLIDVVVAVVIGWLVGRVNLLVRRHLSLPAAGVAISIMAPFVAWIPTDLLGGSGLVAAVTAGLVTGYGAPRYLSAQDRLAERAVWRTLELVLEGGVFLLLGLEAFTLVDDVRSAHGSAAIAVVLAIILTTVVIAVRAAFIAPSLWALGRRRRAREHERERLTASPHRGEDDAPAVRRSADLDYLADQRLGPKEGMILVWAGMRGAVTVAAAQSLPANTPQRSLLLLVAFAVATGTLLVQGTTLPVLARMLKLDPPADDSEARTALWTDLVTAASARLTEPGLVRSDGQKFTEGVLARVGTELAPLQRLTDTPTGHGTAIRAEYLHLRTLLIEAQRTELVRLRDLGVYPSGVLDEALHQLDADQLGLDPG